MNSTDNFYWKDITSSEILDNLFQINNKYTFLAGAGVSLDSPSNLPTGHQFTKKLLEIIVPREEITSIMELMNPEREGMRSSGDFLRFEQLVEYIHSFDDNFTILKPYEVCSYPNYTHKFLAQTILSGHDVFTTNIDALIEYGLESVGVDRNKIWPVITEEHYSNPVPEGSYPVYKLHGSILNLNTGENVSDTLQVTLSQIHQATDEDFSMEEWERQVLEKSVQSNATVLFGYSGLDDFDVIPTLKTIQSSTHIIWITHEHERTIDNTKVLEIKLGTDPEHRHDLDDRVEHHLETLRMSSSENRRIIRIFVNTKELIQFIARKMELMVTETNESGQFHVDLNETFQSLEVEKGYPYFLSAQIFKYYGYPEKAKTNGLNALQIFKDENNHPRTSMVHDFMGLLYREEGDPEKALEHHQMSYNIGKQLNDDKILGRSLNNMALALEDQGKVDEALDYFIQSSDIAVKNNEYFRAGILLNNIASMMHSKGDVDEAIKVFERAIEMQDHGDLTHKADTLANYADLLIDEGRFEEALEQLHRAYQINDQLGQSYKKSSNILTLGSTYSQLGRNKEAFDYYQQSLEIAEQFNYDSLKLKAYHNMGSMYSHQGNFDDSRTYYEKSLDLSNKLDWPSWSLSTMINLGLLYKRHGDINKALEYYTKSLDMADAAEDLTRKATVINNIGRIYKDQGDFRKAINYYQQSMEISKQMDDKFGIGRGLNNVGTILMQVGEVKQAVDFFYQAFTIHNEMQNYDHIATALVNLGVGLEKLGNIEKAKEAFQQVLPLVQQLQMHDIESFVKNKLSQL